MGSPAYARRLAEDCAQRAALKAEARALHTKRAMELRAEGLTCTEIARRIGRSPQWVALALRGGK